MSAIVYDYPVSSLIEEIEQKLLPKRVADSPFLRIFPFDSQDAEVLTWEQKDNYTGLQQWRGYNNQAPTVQRKDRKRYVAFPGQYGEQIRLNEEELTRRRRNASFGGGPIPITDLVGEAHEQLLNRRLNLVEKIVADLSITGTFSVADIEGQTVYSGSYTQQQFTPTIPWSTLATSIPLQDMRQYRTFEFGQSVSFGPGAVQLMNLNTTNKILANSNANDLGGKRLNYGETINALADYNKLLGMNEIPPIEVYNGGYIDDGGTFHLFIPDGKVLVVGKRLSGSRVGTYRYTRNVNSMNGAPAPYVKVWVDERVPTQVEVHDGHNGGPTIQYPGTLILVNAY